MESYCTYLIPGESAPLVPEFAVEDLPLDTIATLVPEFSVKDLPLGRTLDDIIIIIIIIIIINIIIIIIIIMEHWDVPQEYVAKK